VVARGFALGGFQSPRFRKDPTPTHRRRFIVGFMKDGFQTRQKLKKNEIQEAWYIGSVNPREINNQSIEQPNYAVAASKNDSSRSNSLSAPTSMKVFCACIKYAWARSG
jgi:hypothetical protein